MSGGQIAEPHVRLYQHRTARPYGTDGAWAYPPFEYRNGRGYGIEVAIAPGAEPREYARIPSPEAVAVARPPYSARVRAWLAALWGGR